MYFIKDAVEIQGASGTMAFAMDEVSQVREKIDIVSLISEYLPLKKMGRNFKTVCPFHSEKTPSFVVSPERQIWHCFGCSKGGDVYTFLMEYENMEFREALRVLAKKAGIELRESSFQQGVTSQKEKIYAINFQAMQFYKYLLHKHPIGKKALGYLVDERKIKPKVIETFNLGFSPRIGNALSQYLIKKKQYQKEDLLASGLAYQKEQEIVDFFKGRVMFPLFDQRDNILGFSGRTLFSDQDSKYINTKETPVYQKANHFFGFNIAKEQMKKEGRAIVVEGEFDVISLFQEGITNVVAVKGSSLTENQVILLSRFAKKVILCFDVDAAGEGAIKKALPILENKSLTAFVIEIKDGKDPDEAIKTNPFAFKKALNTDISIYDFLFSKTFSHNDKNTVEGKKNIAEELLSVISLIENEIVKEHYLKKLSKELDISYESLIKELSKTKNREKNSTTLSFTSIRDKKLREELLEQYLLALIIQAENPKTAINTVMPILNKIKDIEFKAPSYQKILDYLIDYYKIHNGQKNQFDSGQFLKTIPKELVESFDNCFIFPLPKFDGVDEHIMELKKVAEELRVLRVRSSIKTLSSKIKEKEELGEEKDASLLKEEFSHLISQLRQN